MLSLKLQRIVYTKFASALEQIAKFEDIATESDFDKEDFEVEDFIEQFEEMETYA